jgi:GntR family transcriptional regulator, transcriptional repressor for pyruvate dehydrogenase complex
MRAQRQQASIKRKPGYQPIKVKRVFEEVCTQIRRQIIAGALKPGDKLPAERDLASEFGVGRAAVREALRSLEISGVINLQKGVKGGAFIQHVDPGVVSKSLGDMVSLGTVSLEMLTETRILLMTPTIELVCKRATATDFTAIAQTIEDTEHAGTFADRLECSRAFYAALARASHNQLLEILADAANSVVFDLIEELEPPVMPDVARSRRKLLELLRERDGAKATKEVKAQLAEVHDFLLTNVKRLARNA